ncbi:MFS transporter, partial [Candidatus Latescibacterota bacterium]
MNRLRIILLLALGHGVTDIYPGLLSPFLPIFTDRYGWSITRAGILVTVLQLTSNLSQPFFAVFNDHRPTRSIMWLGLVISGLPFCFMLSIDSFPAVALLLTVCGIGVGMYHPSGVTAAGRIAAGTRTGSLLGMFTAGGLIGFTIAPLIAVLFIEVIGERYLPLVLLPAILTGITIALDRDIPLPKGHGYTVREWSVSL